MPVINEKTIPDGYSGTAETIKEMWKLVNKESKDQHLRNIARKITENVTAKDYFGEAKSLFNFVKGRTKFVRDPEGAERIADPFVTITEKSGDCDDHAILLGSLAKSIGFPVRFVTISSIRPGFFNHVYAEVFVPRLGWLPADTTEPESYLGWDPKPYFSKQVWNDPTGNSGGVSMNRVNGLGDWITDAINTYGTQAVDKVVSNFVSKYTAPKQAVALAPTPTTPIVPKIPTAPEPVKILGLSPLVFAGITVGTVVVIGGTIYFITRE